MDLGCTTSIDIINDLVPLDGKRVIGDAFTLVDVE